MKGRRGSTISSGAIGPVRFVVGHTMTSGFRVMARFSSRVFLIDTGMLSSYYQGGRASALEIQRGTTRSSRSTAGRCSSIR